MNTVFRQTLVKFILAFSLLSTSQAQNLESLPGVIWRNPDRTGVGARIGLVQFDGDVRNNPNFPGTRLSWHEAMDFFYQYQFLQYRSSIRLAVDMTASYRRLQGMNSSYSFTNKVLPLSAGVEAELFPQSPIRPFLSVGFGLLPYTLSASRDPETRLPYQEVGNKESGVGLWFPVRLGLHYDLTEEIDLQLLFERSVTLTDRLDGIVTRDLDWLNDNFHTIMVGTVWYLKNTPFREDADGDGLFDEEESLYGTDPFHRDTDRDGLTDYAEVMKYRTNPLLSDTDGDGIPDYDEIRLYKTSPLERDTDGDGFFDGEELTRKTDPLNPDTDGDGIIDSLDKCPLSPETYNDFEDGDGCPDDEEKLVDLSIRMNALLIVENIEFERNKDILRPSSFPILDQVAAGLSNNPLVTIEVSGHTDSRGKLNKNMSLSLRRAEAVRNYLVGKGIAPERIIPKGYGPSNPVADNATEEGRSSNRRIEFRIMSVGQ